MHLVEQHDNNVISRPSHYDKAGVDVHLEPIDLIRDCDFCFGNAMKYLFRAPYKGKTAEDLKKARQYLEWRIERRSDLKFTPEQRLVASILELNSTGYGTTLGFLISRIAHSTGLETTYMLMEASAFLDGEIKELSE